MLKLFHGDIMSDLSNISCSELQLEILKRRRAKEQEIRSKYALMEHQIKEKYQVLKDSVKIDKNIVEYINIKQGIKTNNIITERNVRYTIFGIGDFSLNELSAAFMETRNIMPEDIINIAEQGALQSLRNAMLDEIAKLY